MSEMRMLGMCGDIKLSWNSSNIEEVKTVRETFDKKIIQGWSAFREKGGFKGDKIRTFDPDAERIVLVPPISGG